MFNTGFLHHKTFIHVRCVVYAHDGSRGVGFHRRLSVCPHDISKPDVARITKFDVQMFHDESWKPIYFGVKMSKVSHKNSAGVVLCTVLSAGFFYSFSAEAMLALYMLWPGVCPSVWVSFTSLSSTKTTKLVITQQTPHDSLGTVVFWRQRPCWNVNGIIFNGGAKCRWGELKWPYRSVLDFPTQTPYRLKFMSIHHDGPHARRCAGGAILCSV